MDIDIRYRTYDYDNKTAPFFVTQRVGCQAIHRFGRQAQQLTSRQRLHGAFNGGGILAGQDHQKGSMPSSAQACRAVARTASGVAPVMLRWPILRPLRADSLP